MPPVVLYDLGSAPGLLKAGRVLHHRVVGCLDPRVVVGGEGGFICVSVCTYIFLRTYLSLNRVCGNLTQLLLFRCGA